MPISEYGLEQACKQITTVNLDDLEYVRPHRSFPHALEAFRKAIIFFKDITGEEWNGKNHGAFLCNGNVDRDARWNFATSLKVVEEELLAYWKGNSCGDEIEILGYVQAGLEILHQPKPDATLKDPKLIEGTVGLIDLRSFGITPVGKAVIAFMYERYVVQQDAVKVSDPTSEIKGWEKLAPLKTKAALTA